MPFGANSEPDSDMNRLAFGGQHLERRSEAQKKIWLNTHFLVKDRKQSLGPILNKSNKHNNCDI